LNYAKPSHEDGKTIVHALESSSESTPRSWERQAPAWHFQNGIAARSRPYRYHSLFHPSAFSLQPSVFSLQKSPPNILFILVDDLAWSDLGCYGHPWHETPHIDSLAAQGMRFTQAYAPAPICSASRASILTGKTTARLGLEFVVKAESGEQVIEPPQPLKAPPFTLSLDLDENTIEIVHHDIPKYIGGSPLVNDTR